MKPRSSGWMVIAALAAVCLLQISGVNEMVGWSEVATPWLPFPLLVGLLAVTWLVVRRLRDRPRRIVLLAGSCACAFAFDPWFAGGSLIWTVGLHRVLFAGGRARAGWGLVYVLASLGALVIACNRDLWPAFLDDHRELSRLGFLFVAAYTFRIAWLLHEVRLRREVIPVLDVVLYFLFAPSAVVIPYMLAIPRCDRFRAGLARHDLEVERAGARLIAWGCVLAVAAWALRELCDPKSAMFAALRAHDLARAALYALPHYPLQPALEACAISAILVGLVRIFGIELGVAFDRPLLAQSLAEYWRRWNTHFRDVLVELFYVPVALRLRRRKSYAVVMGCISVFVIGSTLFHMPKHYFRYGSFLPPDLHILVENILMGAVVAFSLVRERTKPEPPARTRWHAALRMLRTWTLLLVIVVFAGYGAQYALFGERLPVAIQPWR